MIIIWVKYFKAKYFKYRNHGIFQMRLLYIPKTYVYEIQYTKYA